MVAQHLRLTLVPAESFNSFPHSISIPTELREDGFQPQTYLVQGVKALHAALKLWMKKEVSSFLWRKSLLFLWQD